MLCVGASALFALACICLGFRCRARDRGHTSPLVYLGLLGFGVLCDFLVPSQAFNRHELVLSITICASTAGLLIALLRYWALVAIVPLLFVFSITAYVRIFYGIEVDAHLISQVIGASPQDVAQFTTVGNILYILLLLIGIAGFALLLAKWVRTECRVLLGATSCFLLLASIFVSRAGFFAPLSAEAGMGIGCASSIFRIVHAYNLAKARNSEFLQKIAKLPSPAELPSHISTLQGGEGVTVILHMGESVRADRLGINGYERDTPPLGSSRVPTLSISRTAQRLPTLPLAQVSPF